MGPDERCRGSTRPRGGGGCVPAAVSSLASCAGGRRSSALAIVSAVANLAALLATPPFVLAGTLSASLAVFLPLRRWWPVRGIIAALLVGPVAACVVYCVLRDAGRGALGIDGCRFEAAARPKWLDGRSRVG